MTGALHPRLQAALERDGLSLSKLAEVVGLDSRTVAKWGLDDEYGSRATAFRQLEAVIDGRARVVKNDGIWSVVLMPAPISPADLAVALARIEAAQAALAAAIDSVKGLSLGVTETYKSYDGKHATEANPPLTEGRSEVMLAVMLNPHVIRTAASEIDTQHRGKPMVNVSIKLPEGFRERIDAAARKNGMTWAEYLRSLGWIFSEKLEE